VQLGLLDYLEKQALWHSAELTHHHSFHELRLYQGALLPFLSYTVGGNNLAAEFQPELLLWPHPILKQVEVFKGQPLPHEADCN